jgi:protein O-mannosyl-transferase
MRAVPKHRGRSRPPRAPQPPPPAGTAVSRPAGAGPWTRIVLAIALAAITIAVFAPVRHFDFVELDDPLYVRENPHVAGGLTLDGVTWAITTPYAGFWIPAVWVSYMADISAYGPGPGGHHVTNLALHIIAALLLFGWLASATGAEGRSWVVAALFAVHPLRVESVAWITERKDVLSAVWWMLALWAYRAWVLRPGWHRYVLLAACFAAGLASKPMVITLPVVLLLVDIWPLERVPHLFAGWAAWRPRLIEKLPLFAIGAAAAVVTVFAHAEQGAIVGLAGASFGLRAVNALVACVAYVRTTVWPAGLAAVYPLRPDIPAWTIGGAAALFAGLTAAALATARRRPYIATGWFWYLVMLLPVIGLLQVGMQARADRFTYLPAIGLFVIAAWGVTDVVPRRTWTSAALAAAAFLTVAAYGAAARAQVWHWQDSVALWTRAWMIDLGLDEYGAHMDLGRTLRAERRLAEAAEHFERAVRLRPDLPDPHVDLGVTHKIAGRDASAIAEYEQALRIQPANPEALNNLGALLYKRGHVEEALSRFQEALRARPGFVEPHVNLGLAYLQSGRTMDATAEFEAALKLDPENQAAREALARAKSEHFTIR